MQNVHACVIIDHLTATKLTYFQSIITCTNLTYQLPIITYVIMIHDHDDLFVVARAARQRTSSACVKCKNQSLQTALVQGVFPDQLCRASLCSDGCIHSVLPRSSW